MLKNKSKTIQILKVIGTVAMCVIALSHPRGASAVIEFISRENKKREFKLKKREFMKMLWYLRKKKYVKIIEKEDSKIKLKITGKGIERVKNFDIDNLRVEPTLPWDQKWRIVIFDIPAKYNRIREVFRSKLKELNFVMVQKSVWACPWDCLDEVLLLRKLLNIESAVSIFIADAVDEEMKLRRKFGLDHLGHLSTN